MQAQARAAQVGYESARANRTAVVLRLLDAGVTQYRVAKWLGVSQNTIAAIRKTAAARSMTEEKMKMNDPIPGYVTLICDQGDEFGPTMLAVCAEDRVEEAIAYNVATYRIEREQITIRPATRAERVKAEESGELFNAR